MLTCRTCRRAKDAMSLRWAKVTHSEATVIPYLTKGLADGRFSMLDVECRGSRRRAPETLTQMPGPPRARASQRLLSCPVHGHGHCPSTAVPCNHFNPLSPYRWPNMTSDSSSLSRPRFCLTTLSCQLPKKTSLFSWPHRPDASLCPFLALDNVFTPSSLTISVLIEST